MRSAPQVVLPTYTTTFSVQDYLELTEDAGPAPASGILTATFDGPAAGEWWLIDRITVGCDSFAPTTASVYVRQVLPANLRDFTHAGNGNIADEVQPIAVPGPAQVLVQWTGADMGSDAIANLQVRRVTRELSSS